eukprot:TRINITY_DN3191_c0_g1_i2.p1 TRINITY_DN3191_c0_g1~~TRINITY_DN3191_c0_g1_i2.p1  ORF type:complete len:303 (+),score=50.55 TRINITY_DN3191_c0_g1_i2:60-968(+)
MEALWYHLIDLCGSERAFFVVSLFVVHVVVFVGLNIFWTFVRKNNWWPQYRINHKDPPPELVNKAIKQLTLTHVGGLVTWWLLYPVFTSRGLVVRSPLPSFQTVVLHVLFSMACEDTLFYWSHRMLHHRSIYKYIHKQHHEFINTIGIASEYAHPVEAVFANYVPFLCGTFILGSHHFTLLVWLVLRVFETIDAHCGYELPWSPWNLLLAVQGGAARHDFHHSHNLGSYGSFTKFWDWAMGTDIPFKEYQAKLRANEAKGSSKTNGKTASKTNGKTASKTNGKTASKTAGKTTKVQNQKKTK